MFHENDYFTNESIVKRYKASDGMDNSIAKQYKVFSEGKTTIEVTPVEWKKKSLVSSFVSVLFFFVHFFSFVFFFFKQSYAIRFPQELQRRIERRRAFLIISGWCLNIFCFYRCYF